MEIEINLQNVNFCDGCPCLLQNPAKCNMGYWCSEDVKGYIVYGINQDRDKGFERPNICIQNHGV